MKNISWQMVVLTALLLAFMCVIYIDTDDPPTREKVLVWFETIFSFLLGGAIGGAVGNRIGLLQGRMPQKNADKA